MKKISINDITKYSDWAEKLLNTENLIKKKKTQENVIREFEIETWGNIKNSISRNDYDINYIENKYCPLEKIQPFFFKNDFYLASNKVILNHHLKVYDTFLSKYIKNASSIIEFGAGFGSKIIRLSCKKKYSSIPKYAAELTSSGQYLIKNIAKKMGIEIFVGAINLKENYISNIKVPENGIIFTSYSAHYDPKMTESFAEFLYSFNPSIIINFEPCYELYPTSTVHGILSKKYIDINDYSKNIWSIINNYCMKNNIKIKKKENIIGWNPFMPISIIEWGKDLI